MPLRRQPNLSAVTTYLPNTYEARSRCWNCGRFVASAPVMMVRRCAHCDVSWNAPLVARGSSYTTPEIRAAQSAQTLKSTAAHYFMTPGRPWADVFDRYINFAETPVGCPA